MSEQKQNPAKPLKDSPGNSPPAPENSSPKTSRDWVSQDFWAVNDQDVNRIKELLNSPSGLEQWKARQAGQVQPDQLPPESKPKVSPKS